MLTTVKGHINPNGQILLEDINLPKAKVKLMVTILDEEINEDSQLS